MYKSLFKEKNGRLVLRQKNEKRRDGSGPVSKVDEATTLLVKFYE
jgi:hypothetical protein